MESFTLVIQGRYARLHGRDQHVLATVERPREDQVLLTFISSHKTLGEVLAAAAEAAADDIIEAAQAEVDMTSGHTEGEHQ